MKIDFYDIQEMGEESGREEAADDFPFLPRNVYADETYSALYRVIYRHGRARAQGFYELRGKAARAFAHLWAIGYLANCDLFERHDHYGNNENELIV